MGRALERKLALWPIGLASVLLVAGARTGAAQGVSPQGTSASAPAKKQQTDTSIKIEIYGFTQGDMINDFKTNDPNWFDVNRPSKLPAFTDEFGHNGHTWLSGRQTRFGTKATIPTSTQPITVVFDWDLFGVGVDAGQTTIRPRHMYGQWGHFGGGQLESPFMDLDVFPNILEYWGPNGMLFFRNVQFFYEPMNNGNGTRLIFAIERPGASGDAGVVADREELQNILARFPVPDLSGTYRYAGNWGYVKFGGMLRWIRWDDVLTNDRFDLNGGVTGWGVSVSSGIKAGKKDLIHAQVIYGAGVENYFNDAPVDVAAGTDAGSPRTGFIKGVALPITGVTAFIDHTWNPKFTSTFGYSQNVIDNSDLQHANAFHMGQYALANLLYTPDPKIMGGAEVGYEKRTNNADGFTVDNWVLHISLKYNFSGTFGGGQ